MIQCGRWRWSARLHIASVLQPHFVAGHLGPPRDSTNPEGNKVLFDIMHLIDGTRSIAEIARACDVSFEVAKKTIAEFHRHGLVEYLSAVNKPR